MKQFYIKKRIENQINSVKSISKNSLLLKLLQRVGILFICSFLVIGVILTSVIGHKSSTHLKQSRIQENDLLSKQQSLKFSKTVQNLNNLKELILKNLEDSTNDQVHLSDFSKEMVAFEDNSIRSSISNYKEKAVGFISSKNQILDEDFKIKFDKVFKIVQSTGSAFKDEYYMTWVIFPNDSNITYCKENPDVNHEIAHDFSDTSQSYWIDSTIAKNPSMKGKWLKPYYDKAFDKWMVSYVIPIVVNHNHVMTIGFDISLKKLFDSLQKSDEGFGFIVASNGDLIAHPKYMTEIFKSGGLVNVNNLENKGYSNLLAKDGFYSEDGKYIIVSSIDYTDWKYVSVYESFSYASLIPNVMLWMTVISIIGLLMFAMIYFTIRNHLIEPLNELVDSISINPVNIFEPIKYDENVISEINPVFELYKRFIIVIKNKDKDFANLKQFQAMTVTENVDRELVKMRSTQFKTMLKDMEENVFQRTNLMRLNVDKIKAKVSEADREMLKPITDLIYNEYLETKKTNDKYKVLSVDSEAEQLTYQDLDSVLSPVEDMFVKKLESLNIKYIKNYDTKTKFQIKEYMIQKGFIALFENAIEAIKNSPEEKWIKLETVIDENYIELRFSDSGKGIPADVEKNMFKSGWSNKKGHSGMGLSVFNQLSVEMNDAVAILFDNKAQNTTFRVLMLKKDNKILKSA